MMPYWRRVMVLAFGSVTVIMLAQWYYMSRRQCTHVCEQCHLATRTTAGLERSVLELLPTPFDGRCEAMFQDDAGFEYSAAYLSRRPDYLTHAGKMDTTERGSDTFDEQSKLLHLLARAPETRVVCETGFNLGNSAYTFLTAADDVIVYSFDIGEHPGTRPMVKYLNGIFGSRLQVHLGDSMKTVPAFHRAQPEVKCDVIFVDGGHVGDVPWADISNFYSLAVPGKSIVIFDDYPTDWGLLGARMAMAGAWERAVYSKLVRELFRCSKKGHRLQRGFTVGIVGA